MSSVEVALTVALCTIPHCLLHILLLDLKSEKPRLTWIFFE